MNPLQLGKSSENQAVRYLERSGYRILKRNVRSKLGEIDVVAQDGGTLCFVEIKSRSGTRFGLPEEAVSRRKQWKLTRLAQAYLSRASNPYQAARFDVLSVIATPGAEAQFRLIKGAFDSSC